MNQLPLIASHFLRAGWRWHSLRGKQLERYQEQRAQAIVTYALRHSPFYREHWAGCDARDWRRLPLVDKQLMMDHFDTFNTHGIKREAAFEVALQSERSRNFRPQIDGLTVGLSSGTSGHRGLFLASPHEQAAWAGTILSRMIRSLRRRLRVAFFLRSNSNLYEQIGGLLIQFRYFDLMQPLDDAIESLNEYRPDVLIGPPSLLGFLAHAYEQRQLHSAPQRLVSVAEVLEPQDRTRIERSFGTPIEQIYQATEGLLAVSCSAGALHIQEDIVALQFEPLPGEDSTRVTPIVTDLWRRTQPIIRYRLNDVLQLDQQPCSCGSPFRVIRAIEGRCDDVCYFESRDRALRPFFPDTIRRAILLASSDITDYLAIQERTGQLDIYLSATEGAAFHAVGAAVRASISATIAQYNCLLNQLELIPGLPPRPVGNKRRRVQNLAQNKKL